MSFDLSSGLFKIFCSVFYSFFLKHQMLNWLQFNNSDGATCLKMHILPSYRPKELTWNNLGKIEPILAIISNFTTSMYVRGIEHHDLSTYAFKELLD